MSSETLTGREIGVLTLLARGKSNKEIGANLFISETTVKGHLRNIFTKLNVLSRTEAVTVATVYIYYLPTYQLRAQEQGERAWPCKIGRTDRDPLSRVLSQAATALPERPRIAIIIRTSYPSAWESALHSMLTLRGLRIENVPGVEWFLTSPEEILGLVRVFDPKMSNRSPDTGVITPGA